MAFALKRLLFCIPLAFALVLVGGCSQLPTTSRTGQVVEVAIADGLSPAEVVVAPGDEVRWVNRQRGTAELVFLDSIHSQLSCAYGFGMAGVVNRTKVQPNRHFSLCFSTAGKIQYVVRLEVPTRTGQSNFRGQVLIKS
jgi:plastocyanin